MADPLGTLSWNLGAIARSLNITEDDTMEYFTDGRRVSFIIERRLAHEVLHGRLAPSEGASFDVFDSDDNQWEVRSITEGSGIYFCPSKMKGSGRHFEERGFLEKLDEIVGYYVSDIERFPDVPYWSVSSEQVRRWWEERRLGTTTSISRVRALDLLRRMP